MCDGSAVSRTTYASLFSVIAPSGAFTVTIASPAVFTKASHGLVIGDMVSFTTTGALPTGLSVATTYYVISAGLTGSTFEVALSPGGAAINTTGTQSGTHTVYNTMYGLGNGSTTFTLPDLRAKKPIGLGQSTITLSFEAALVDTTNNWVTSLNTVFPSQGQPVVLTTTGTLPAGLSLATTYYVVRISTTTYGFATTQALADAATLIDITTQGTGIHTLTYTTVNHTVQGRNGGEDTHGLALSETPSHFHTVTGNPGGANSSGASANGVSNVGSQNTSSVGSDAQHNNQSPFIVLNYIIKI